MIKNIKDYEFDVKPFTAYESIMLASDLAGHISRVFKNYDKGSPVMSILNAFEGLEGEVVVSLIKKITAKTYFKKQPLDLNDVGWAKKNLITIVELCIEIVKDEYEDLFVESGLGEIMNLSQDKEEVVED